MSSMDIFDSHYFRLNVKLLSFLGLWPYAPRRKYVRCFWPILLIIVNLPHINGVILDLTDIPHLLPHFIAVFTLIAVFLKHLTLVFAAKQMESVYSDIASNWKLITDEEEKKILSRYSERGRMFTLVYIGVMAMANVTFTSLPLLPPLLNHFKPLPVPRPSMNMMQGEFMVENADDHFFKIYLWDVMTLIAIVIICIGIDTMYTASIDHASALCAIVTHRLSKLRDRVDNDLRNATDTSYEWMVGIVKLHQIALSFVDNINNSYSLCFFCLTIMNIATLPICSVMILVNLDNPIDIFRFGTILISLKFHLFVLFWPGQRIIDHTESLIEDTYCNDWYETPAKTKRILTIMMIRCAQPCKLTAGGLLDMNFEVYMSVVKTSASYITVLGSFQ